MVPIPLVPKFAATKPAANGTANAKSGWRRKNIISAGNMTAAKAIAHRATNQYRENGRVTTNQITAKAMPSRE
jgi:hypothetical protein